MWNIKITHFLLCLTAGNIRGVAEELATCKGYNSLPTEETFPPHFLEISKSKKI